MSGNIEIKPLYMGVADAKPPKATLWNWLEYYIYNLVRKPKVWAKKRELIRIADEIVHNLSVEIMPKLWRARLVCRGCKDAYMALNSQIFASNIKMILTRLSCEDHPEPFTEFLNKHHAEFERSEDIAMWINGFKR